MRYFRNIFGMLAVMAIFALALAPPGYAAGGDTESLYLENLINNGLTAGANPYEGDIVALVTSVSGEERSAANADVKESEFITLTAKPATKGGDATASGTEPPREYAI